MRLAAAQSATSLKTGQTPAWHEHLATILDGQDPLTAVIHPYEYSSQRNEPEAELVAGLMRSRYGRLLPEQGDDRSTAPASSGTALGLQLSNVLRARVTQSPIGTGQEGRSLPVKLAPL